nr:uncharacterized mitochondrial protein AtMg00810-like [Tanacetum cinerariifolium]
MTKVLPPKTTEEVVARERERKARTTLLMALPEDHLSKFHKMADAKEMWEAIKSRFGGNDKSKKMQKYLLIQQFEGFSMSASEDLYKGYDRAKWNQDSRRRDGGYNGNKVRDNSRRPASQDDSKSLVTIDGEAIDWSGHVEEDIQNFAMMAYSSSNSGSDNESAFLYEFEELMKNRFQMSSMGELTFFLGLQVKQKEDGIFIIQDKYVAEILKKFDFLSVKTASTPIKTQKPLVKDEEAADVDVNLYRSMIGYSQTSHLQAMKRIFRYLKGQPKLGLWYPKVSSFDMEAYSDCDYAGVILDRKSTTGGCQFLGMRLISWQCKKQTIMATSTIEA